MSRKATDRVTTIGIDIGKNGFHLIGLDGRFGSKAVVGKARFDTNQGVLERLDKGRTRARCRLVSRHSITPQA